MRVAELGGVVLEPRWLGNKRPHRVRCGAGHDCDPTPNAVQKQGICRVCAGNDPETAWNEFRMRVAELGGVVLEPRWLGNKRPHRVRCGAGHDCDPIPNAVQSGQGICRSCVGSTWDVFYVVSDEAAERVKFGVTSGAPKPRLAAHARDGYTTVRKLLVGLPEGIALALERAVRIKLKQQGHIPVRGREYFNGAAIPLILEVVGSAPDL